MPTEPYEIRNRWTNEVQFTAQIDCSPDLHWTAKLGLAVKWGITNRASLDGASLVGASLDGASLVGASLDGARLVGARLDGARLDGASLDGASLDRASLVGASLDRASLDRASLDGASLDGASLDGASLVGASLDRARLVGARLDGASLDGASLDGARLDGASLDGASLVGASLDGARLVGASLDGALVRNKKIRRLITAISRQEDAYVFYAFETEKDGVWVMAGCRWFSLPAYRDHVGNEYPGTTKAVETLDILDFIETRAKRLEIKL